MAINLGSRRPSRSGVEAKKIFTRHQHYYYSPQYRGDAAASCSAKEQKKSSSSMPGCHALMKFIIPSLLVIIGLKYQGNADTLFMQQPVQAWSLLGTICAYCLVALSMKEIPNLPKRSLEILNHAALASGFLSVVSAGSICFPPKVSLALFLTGAFLFVAFIIAFYSFGWFWRTTLRVVDYIRRRDKMTGGGTGEVVRRDGKCLPV